MPLSPFHSSIVANTRGFAQSGGTAQVTLLWLTSRLLIFPSCRQMYYSILQEFSPFRHANLKDNVTAFPPKFQSVLNFRIKPSAPCLAKLFIPRKIRSYSGTADPGLFLAWRTRLMLQECQTAISAPSAVLQRNCLSKKSMITRRKLRLKKKKKKSVLMIGSDNPEHKQVGASFKCKHLSKNIHPAVSLQPVHQEHQILL